MVTVNKFTVTKTFTYFTFRIHCSGITSLLFLTTVLTIAKTFLRDIIFMFTKIALIGYSPDYFLVNAFNDYKNSLQIIPGSYVFNGILFRTA